MFNLLSDALQARRVTAFHEADCRDHYVNVGPVLDAAVWYATHWGALVVPADPILKKPMIRTGKSHSENSSAVPRVLRSWPQWSVPGVRIALVTGPVSGLLVIDVDSSATVNGLESLRQLEERLGALPETPRQRTPRGFHLVFAYPSDIDIRNSASKLAPGIDIRGIGGIFIVPPAPERRWDTDAHPTQLRPANLPANWIGALTCSAGRSLGSAAMASNGARTFGRHRAGSDGRFRLPDLILAGERNDTLFRYASSMHARMVTWSRLVAAVERINRERCRPCLADTEVQAILSSVERYRVE